MKRNLTRPDKMNQMNICAMTFVPKPEIFSRTLEIPLNCFVCKQTYRF